MIWQNALALNRLYDTGTLDQARLSESEARLKLAVKSSRIGFWDWHVQGHRLFLSPEWKDQLGYGEDELADRFEEWESRLHPDDKARVLRHIEEYFVQSDAAYEEEFRLRHKDGSHRWIYTRAELLRDAAGKPQRMTGCHVDITERKRAELAARDSAERTRRLHQRLVEAQEDERRAIHRELHDRIGQDLAVAKLNIELAGDSSSALAPRLEVAREHVQNAIDNSRDLMRELRPCGLDDHGLKVALELFAQTVTKRYSIPVAVHAEDVVPRLPSEIERALFRITQEAINNLAKHANARTVGILLCEEAHEVRLSISDDGFGFDCTGLHASGSYGLQIMRERAEAVNAKLEIESEPGHGTRITAIIERAI